MIASVEVRDLVREYRMGDERVAALKGVTFTVERGDYAAIVGPSGCGKSTLLNLLGVIDRPTGGSVSIAGERVDQLSDARATDFRLRRIGFVFQRFYLMQALTARENVELPLSEAGLRGAERRDRAMALLDYVGLARRERHRPSQLSGGEQQRVAIANSHHAIDVARDIRIMRDDHDRQAKCAIERMEQVEDRRRRRRVELAGRLIG